MFKGNFDINLDVFKLKAPSLIGVDIGSSSVKMVELSLADKVSQTYCLERYVIEPMPMDAIVDGGIANMEAVSECLQRGWKRMGTKQKNVALALPATDVITKIITVPAGQREEDLVFQVEREASQYVPFPLEEVDLDFQINKQIADKPEEIELLIAASRKEKVEDRVAAALASELKAVVMDVEPYAAQAALELALYQLANDGTDQVIALVDIGTAVMRINVMLNGEFVYTRDQPFGANQLTQEIHNQFNLSLEESEIAKRSGNLPENYRTELLRPFCETLAIEVARALQFFYTSTQYSEVNYIFIAGGTAAIPGLDTVIAERTQVSTLIANPFSKMELASRVIPRQLNLDAPALLIACGLALRAFDPS